MTETETADVRDALDHLSTVTFDSSAIDDGIQVTLSEDEIGQFFAAVRREGFESEAKRLNDNLVAHIEAEESGGLGELFG